MGKPATVSKHLTLSPLDGACLLVLAERQAGGGRAEDVRVVEGLLRETMGALLGVDVTSVRVEVAADATPLVRRDAYAVKLREMLNAVDKRLNKEMNG